MKRISILLCLLLITYGLAFGNSHKYFNMTSEELFDSGGPDEYGYSWEDNDNGGNVVYEWIDISTIGTKIEGLLDDNNVGPFELGFDFPYYWYNVNKLWIGSNGYISFSSNANFAYPFAGIPTVDLPNDLVAILTGDLDFTKGSPECYFYTNEDDTCIISFINVSEFEEDFTYHNFQAIFSAADSSIKFQYGENFGNFVDFNGTTLTVIGIEDVTGQFGIEYLHDNFPTDRKWHEGLAIKFHPEPDPAFEFHDISIKYALSEDSKGKLVALGDSVKIEVMVTNLGTELEGSVTVSCRVRQNITDISYEEITIDNLESGEERLVEFPGYFKAEEAGLTYKAIFTAMLEQDELILNNQKICEITTYELPLGIPQEISYSDDIVDYGYNWSGDFTGYGVEYKFDKTVRLDSAKVFIPEVMEPGPAYVWVVTQSWPSGLPNMSRILGADTVMIDTIGWYNFNLLDDNIDIYAKWKFWVIIIVAYDDTFLIGVDESTPISRTSCEFLNTLSPDREGERHDIMLKIFVEQSSVYIDEPTTPKTFSIYQNYPNPFNVSTNIKFVMGKSSDVVIGIFNILGQKVADFSGYYDAGENIISWDASEIVSGVYFYKFETDSQNEIRKMVLIK